MSTLEQIIVRDSKFTPGELCQVKFAHPSVGLIEAIRCSSGIEKGRGILELVSKAQGVPLLDGSALRIDEHLIGSGGEELQRLVYSFRALPLNWIGNEAKRKVRLAMADPTDRYAQAVFSRFLGAQVVVCSAYEQDLFQVLNLALDACPPGADHRSKLKRYEYTEAIPEQTEEIRKALNLLINQAIARSAKEIELECSSSLTRAILELPLGRTKTLDLLVAPEEFVSALVARAELRKTERAVFEGTCHLLIKDATVDADIKFHKHYKTRLGTKGKVLVISNIKVNSKNRTSMQFGEPTSSVNEFDKTLSKSPGLFVTGFSSAQLKQEAIADLKRRYPDLYVVPDLRTLATDASLPSRVKHSRVLVTLQSNSLLGLLKQLDPMPINVRSLVRAVFASVRVPRICYCCTEVCKPTEESLALFPESYRQHVELLKYPRGCSICEKRGYSGSLGLCSMMSAESQGGQAFLRGQPSSEVIKLLRSDGFRTLPETGLYSVLAGNTTIEMLSKSLLGKADIPYHFFLTMGKEIVRAGLAKATASEKKEGSSPDGSKRPKMSVSDFHSVVLDLDDDFLSRSAELLEDEELEEAF